jgi:hypothetical protein
MRSRGKESKSGFADVEDVSLISLQSNTEKDSEYLEKYASLPKTVFRSSSPILNSSSSLTEVDRDAKYDSLNFENQIKDHYANTPFFEGTIVLFLKSQLTKL